MRSNGVTATFTTVQEVPREKVFKELPFRSNFGSNFVLFCSSVHTAIDRSPIVDHHVALKALEVREGRVDARGAPEGHDARTRLREGG